MLKMGIFSKEIIINFSIILAFIVIDVVLTNSVKDGKFITQTIWLTYCNCYIGFQTKSVEQIIVKKNSSSVVEQKFYKHLDIKNGFPSMNELRK